MSPSSTDSLGDLLLILAGGARRAASLLSWAIAVAASVPAAQRAWTAIISSGSFQTSERPLFANMNSRKLSKDLPQAVLCLRSLSLTGRVKNRAAPTPNSDAVAEAGRSAGQTQTGKLTAPWGIACALCGEATR
jgi:hypothetical protein